MSETTLALLFGLLNTGLIAILGVLANKKLKSAETFAKKSEGEVSLSEAAQTQSETARIQISTFKEEFIVPFQIKLAAITKALEEERAARASDNIAATALRAADQLQFKASQAEDKIVTEKNRQAYLLKLTAIEKELSEVREESRRKTAALEYLVGMVSATHAAEVAIAIRISKGE